MQSTETARGYWRFLWRLLLSLAVLGLCLLFFRKIEFHKVWQSLRQADWRLVLVAAVLNVTVNLWARVERWKALLDPLPHSGKGASLRELSALLVASYASSNVLPGRAGEALRTFELYRRYRYPVASLVAAQLIEKAVEGLSMAVLALCALAFANPARHLWPPIMGLAGLGLGSVVLVSIVATGHRRWGWGMRAPASEPPIEPSGLWAQIKARAASFFYGLGEAVHLIHAPRVWARSMIFSFLSDFIDISLLGLCLYAVGIHVGLSGWLLTLLTLNLAIVVPSTPGQIGVHEAGTVLGLTALGVNQDVALAGALIYHAVHVLPTTIVGLICLRTQFLRDAPDRDKSAGAQKTLPGA